MEKNMDEVVLNEKVITLDELQQKQKELEKEKNISIVEVSKDTYKTKLYD
jgi:hypothetical protein